MRLSIVVPHWPIDGEIDEALRGCLGSLPDDCEKLVIINEGTGFARNVNVGLRLARGDFIAVVTNDTQVIEGWYAANERRFEVKWGWVPPPTDPELSASWTSS